MHRVLPILVLSLALASAACAATPTAPASLAGAGTSRISAPGSARPDVTVMVTTDTTCRSGFSVANGRLC